jgi:DNA-binding XRE family transcriptional regulator
MKTTKWSELKLTRLSPERRAELDAEVEAELVEMDLREIREIAGLTQTQMAERAGIGQGEVSRLERRGDHRLSTLRKYVEAAGGEIEVMAVIGNRRVKLVSA